MTESSSFEHPDRLGRYHILQVIGEGGMGVVYEAEQKEPVRRRVAVKIMKVGMDTKEVMGRFEAERQALAVMEHPGIAKVLDAGATEQGRPYFVMELVRGVRLDEYCNQQLLTTRQRVELFIGVCEAVQHAHQKGVIHRDLKPSNVLVTEESGRPTPKIIDFGIAKATGQKLTQETVVTTYGQALGTLAYMSPEQAEMSGLDVDTRTDVYSLGVTLYELLAGTVPLDPNQVGAWAFLAQLIQRDQTMPTLSHRLAGLTKQQLAQHATQYGTESGRLKKELTGDLQWIIQKAIEKDRTRRYETANGLAMDLKCYLAYEPIMARPPSTIYRVGKFVHRHRSGVVAATVGMVRARGAETVASREAATAQQVSDFLVGLFRVCDPDEARGEEITAREILDRGAERIESELGDEPLVQARLMHTIAEVYVGLAVYGEAGRLARRALELRRSELGVEHEDVAATLALIGNVLGERGDFDGAVEHYREALRILEERVAPGHPMIARTINNLAGTYTRQANYEEALPMLERALALKEEGFGEEHPEVASTLYNLAVLHRNEQRYDTAAALYGRSLAIREAALGPDHPAVARTVSGLAIVYTLLEQYDSAEVLYRSSLEQKERNLGPDHPDLANSLNNLAILFARQDRVADATEMFQRAYEVRLGALGTDHPDVAESLNNLGIVLRTGGRFEESEAAFRRAIDVYEQSLGQYHPRLAETLGNYEGLLRQVGRVVEADAVESRVEAIEARAN